MIAFLLFYKILQLATFMALGFLLVKLKIVKSEDSMVLSKISLYLLMPAAIINAFDVEMNDDIIKGLGLAFVAAIVIHIVLILIDAGYKKLFKGTGVERASVMYPNVANLIIPIVTYVLGEEWVIYNCAFMSVQLVFLWTHGIQLFSSEKKVNLKKILLNINLIAVACGAVLMVSGTRLPGFVKDISSSLGGMIGIVGMLIAGMMAANIDYKKILKNKRLYLVLVMRLLVCPIIVLGVIKLVRMGVDIANVDKILLISFLASISPTAASIMQFAQIHNKDADFAVGINIVTTIFCIVTMPLFVALYQM